MQIISGCKPSVDESARKFLNKYQLHPVYEGKHRSIRLTKNRFYDQIFDTSKKIGLDITKYKNQKVIIAPFPLRERSWEGPVSACLMMHRGKIIGAYLLLDGYIPGIEPLTSKHHFIVPGFRYNNLNFAGISKIEVLGPWVKHGWKKRYSAQKQKEIKLITSFVRRASLLKGEANPVIPDEEYLIVFHFNGGQEVRARLFTPTGTNSLLLSIDEISGWHYIPSRKLKAYVRSVLN